MAAKVESIGSRIKRVREARHISQRKLAKRVGNISEGYISRVETGERDISLVLLRKIARELDVNPVYLETGELTICPHCLRPFEHGRTDNPEYHQG